MGCCSSSQKDAVKATDVLIEEPAPQKVLCGAAKKRVEELFEMCDVEGKKQLEISCFNTAKMSVGPHTCQVFPQLESMDLDGANSVSYISIGEIRAA